MKYAFLIFLALMITGPTVQAADAKPTQAAGGQIVYRNFIWGVSKEDVLKYETVPFYKEEGDSLYFLLQPDVYRRMITYTFKDGGLAAIRYEFLEFSPANTGTAMEISYDEQRKLTELYGPPSKDEAFWKDEEYKTYPEYWARAMYLGDLRLQTTWNPPGSEIVLTTYYDRNITQYKLYYTIVKTETKPPEQTNKIDLLPTVPSQPQTEPAKQP